MPMMKSPYDQVVQSPDGAHTLIVEAEVPVWVPPGVVRHARICFMKVVGDEDVEPPVEAPAETTDNDSEDEFAVSLDQAILRLLTRNVDSDFKNDGRPKINAVVAEMDPDVRRPNATEVSDAFERLQENVNLAE